MTLAADGTQNGKAAQSKSVLMDQSIIFSSIAANVDKCIQVDKIFINYEKKNGLLMHQEFELQRL